MRSRTGCQTCRQRKLKCDEAKPECGQCRRAFRQCVPSAGVVFRHQQNASMNGGTEATDGGKLGKLEGFFAYKNTFDENHVWVDVPKNVTFLQVTDPYNTESMPDEESQASPASTGNSKAGPSASNTPQSTRDQASGRQALSMVASNKSNHLQPLPANASSNTHSYSSHLDLILNPSIPEASMSSPPLDPALSSRPGNSLVEEHEVAFLLRHYSETPGQWMDLYDLGCYFANHLPVAALGNALLRYSACAYAAKQLSRVRGHKSTMGGSTVRQADMELYSHCENVDWAYICAKYYERAISLLMEELSSTNAQKSPATSKCNGYLSPRNDCRPRASPAATDARRQIRNSDADHIIAAAAILCVYEFLDNANNAWARHLSGTKSLFDLADSEEMMPVRSPPTPGAASERVAPSRARRATFWNFARQDFLAAFINEGHTRLNVEDLGLWRAAGLHLDEHGFIVSSNTDDGHYPNRQHFMGTDMICNALVWLMSKIANFLASKKSWDFFPRQMESRTGTTRINRTVMLKRWQELEKELDIWYCGLPEAFGGCVRLPPIVDGSVPSESPRARFPEIWHSEKMCASAMQSYHMARIVLLTNKPYGITAVKPNLQEMSHYHPNLAAESRHHAHEICGIGLSRPDGSVRVNAVQPVFVAGQVLTDNQERRVVIELLQTIEYDTGWATDYRVRQLVREWGWRSDPPYATTHY